MGFSWVLLVAAAQASVGAAATSNPQSAAIVLKAIAICERATQGGTMDFPADAKLYQGSFKIGSIEPTSTLPDLLKRYSATGVSAIDPPSLYLRFASKDGEAWSIIHAKTLTCDVVMTGFRQSERDQDILNEMNKAGWNTIRSAPATQPGYLSQYLLAKMIPIPTEPSYGVRALVKSLGFIPVTAGGVQMEINFVAGRLTVRPPTQPK